MPGERGRPCCSRQVLAMWACAILLPLAMRAALARSTLPPSMPSPVAAAPGEWPSPPGSSFSVGHGSEHSISCGGVPAVMNVSAQGRGVVSGRLEARYVSGAGGSVTGRLVPVPQPCPGGKMLSSGWEQPGPWVAVVPLQPLGYADCPLADKVRHVARAGAAALLLFGDAAEERHALDEAVRDARLLHGNTSAVVAGRAVGDEIVRLARNYSTVFLTMGPAHPCTRTYGAAVNRTSVLFVSISFVVLMIISLAWLVFYYVQRFRYIHAKDRLSRRLCSAAKKALSKIPTKNIKSEDKEIQGDGECCAVCIEPYKVSDVLRILPCRHEFHKSCIDPWLLEHRTCPMCKMDILKHYGFVFTGSQESILHMEIEEVVGLGQAEGHDNDVESLTASPQMRPANGMVHNMSIPSSPELGTHSSGASTPNELSPALSVGPRFATSRHSASTSNRTANTAILRDQVCSNCGSGLTKPVPADSRVNTCIVELQDSASAVADDCDLESCTSNGASPQHSSTANK